MATSDHDHELLDLGVNVDGRGAVDSSHEACCRLRLRGGQLSCLAHAFVNLLRTHQQRVGYQRLSWSLGVAWNNYISG